jgi:hypothetical protein
MLLMVKVVSFRRRAATANFRGSDFGRKAESPRAALSTGGRAKANSCQFPPHPRSAQYGRKRKKQILISFYRLLFTGQ